jgi:hypothetical protein
MTKKYVMPGKVEYGMLLFGKKEKYTCRFSKGAVSGLCYRAASFTTDNKEIQELIEKREEFANGHILIAEVYGEPEETKPEKGNAVDDITTLQEARKFLLEKGATMEELQTKSAVLEKAKELNISFPNWK